MESQSDASDASDAEVSEPSNCGSAIRESAAQQPDFYDPELDEVDERWVDSRRQGRQSDAVLSCPGCLSTVCLECQAHVQYEHQFRAVDVINCRFDLLLRLCTGHANRHCKLQTQCHIQFSSISCLDDPPHTLLSIG